MTLREACVVIETLQNSIALKRDIVRDFFAYGFHAGDRGQPCEPPPFGRNRYLAGYVAGKHTTSTRVLP